ncbi:MAG TPA: hypothetical protein VGQ36_04980 [Thermoanaerobaculia bacterium]|jgi:hypothetical protein|nr:hypothetical protein [Thermoanaerobaculia bacterium]
MIRKSDWQVVQDEMIEADRQQLGEPPTAEEMLAYSRGELSPQEEARVRALLVAYPELAHTLTAPFPAEGDDSLSGEDVSKRWKSFQSQIHGKEARGGKLLQFWRASTALAAGLALVFGGLLWRETSRGPRVLPEAQQLFADGQRGGEGGAVTLTGTDDVFVLVVPLYNPGTFGQFRLEIAGVEPGARPLWRGEVQPRRADDTFRIEIPRAYLDAGRYRVVLYGIDGAREQRLETYTIRVR